jgi:hypothetical protein
MKIIFSKYIPVEILYILSDYLIEPSLIITNIGWNKENNYIIDYSKIDYRNSLEHYYGIIKYYILKYKIETIYVLYTHIYFLNSSFRKFLPTYIFSERIFNKYTYIPYNTLIEVEFDTELNLIKKKKQIEYLHLKCLQNIKLKILKELKYHIEKYIEFKNISNPDLVNYPFYLYFLDTIIFYI